MYIKIQKVELITIGNKNVTEIHFKSLNYPAKKKKKVFGFIFEYIFFHILYL